MDKVKIYNSGLTRVYKITMEAHFKLSNRLDYLWQNKIKSEARRLQKDMWNRKTTVKTRVKICLINIHAKQLTSPAKWKHSSNFVSRWDHWEKLIICRNTFNNLGWKTWPLSNWNPTFMIWYNAMSMKHNFEQWPISLHELIFKLW